MARARRTGHLRHTHQLILLYTAGRLGEEGRDFIHQTIALCSNYRQEVCQGYIDLLDENHPPLSCQRIREWLEEEGESSLCTCPDSRKNPLTVCATTQNETPQKHSTKTQRQSTPLPDSQESIRKDAEWNGVFEDLFGEESDE